MALLILLGVAAGLVLLRWYYRLAQLDWALGRGVALLSSTDGAPDPAAAVARWLDETHPIIEGRQAELIERVFDRYDLADPAVRRILSFATGADYGDRREDWQRWQEAQARLREGQQPRVGRGEHVKMTPLWQAPVGLTAWFTNIVVLDGTIYVASLGSALSSSEDRSDGVVRVEGGRGAAVLLFELPHTGSRDVVGIAAGDQCLFVACSDGVLYCIEPAGTVRWRSDVGGPIAANPLVLDINRNGVLDVLVTIGTRRVVALNGQSGKPAWSVTLPSATGAPLPLHGPVQAVLAAGDLWPTPGVEVLVMTTAGGLAVIDPREARLRWSSAAVPGAVSGALASGWPGVPALAADGGARLWAVQRERDTLRATAAWALASVPSDAIFAGLRTFTAERGKPQVLLATLVGAGAPSGGALCALDAEGVRWRVSPGGMLWGTPAVADLNGDGVSELIAAGVETRGQQALGTLSVVSAGGQILRRFTLAAAIECSPVVADVDGDGKLELLLADQAGMLHCFRTDGFGPVEWGSLGGDPHNTRSPANAYSFGQAPPGFQWKWRPTDPR